MSRHVLLLYIVLGCVGGGLAVSTPITNLHLAYVGVTSVQLQWQPVQGATYSVYTTNITGLANPPPPYSTPTQSIATVTGLAAGTTYSFSVVAGDGPPAVVSTVTESNSGGCMSSIVLPQTSFPIEDSLQGAPPLEGLSSCPKQHSPTGASLWFSWTAPGAGGGPSPTLVSTCFPGTTFPATLDVYSGSCGETNGNFSSLTCLSQSSASCLDGYGSSTLFSATPGSTYYVVVSSVAALQGQAAGPFTLSIGAPSRPPTCGGVGSTWIGSETVQAMWLPPSSSTWLLPYSYVWAVDVESAGGQVQVTSGAVALGSPRVAAIGGLNTTTAYSISVSLTSYGVVGDAITVAVTTRATAQGDSRALPLTQSLGTELEGSTNGALFFLSQTAAGFVVSSEEEEKGLLEGGGRGGGGGGGGATREQEESLHVMQHKGDTGEEEQEQEGGWLGGGLNMTTALGGWTGSPASWYRLTTAAGGASSWGDSRDSSRARDGPVTVQLTTCVAGGSPSSGGSDATRFALFSASSLSEPLELLAVSSPATTCSGGTLTASLGGGDSQLSDSRRTSSPGGPLTYYVVVVAPNYLSVVDFTLSFTEVDLPVEPPTLCRDALSLSPEGSYSVIVTLPPWTRPPSSSGTEPVPPPCGLLSSTILSTPTIDLQWFSFNYTSANTGSLGLNFCSNLTTATVAAFALYQGTPCGDLACVGGAVAIDATCRYGPSGNMMAEGPVAKLPGGKIYYLVVASTLNTGASLSLGLNVNIGPPAQPGTVTITTVSAVSATALWAYSGSSAFTNSVPTHYGLALTQVSTGEVVQEFDVDGVLALIASLQPYTQYSVVIWAVNNAGLSLPSSAKIFQTVALPSSPVVNPFAMSLVYYNFIVGWEPPLDTGGPPATSLYYSVVCSGGIFSYDYSGPVFGTTLMSYGFGVVEEGLTLTCVITPYAPYLPLAGAGPVYGLPNQFTVTTSSRGGTTGAPGTSSSASSTVTIVSGSGNGQVSAGTGTGDDGGKRVRKPMKGGYVFLLVLLSLVVVGNVSLVVLYVVAPETAVRLGLPRINLVGRAAPGTGSYSALGSEGEAARDGAQPRASTYGSV